MKRANAKRVREAKVGCQAMTFFSFFFFFEHSDFFFFLSRNTFLTFFQDIDFFILMAKLWIFLFQTLLV